MNKHYEMLLITDGGLATEEHQTLVNKIKEVTTKSGGTIDGEVAWGRRKLAYEMRKKKHGIYTMIYIQGNGEVVEEIRRQAGYEEKILKVFLLTVKDNAKAKASFEALLADPKKTSKLMTESLGA